MNNPKFLSKSLKTLKIKGDAGSSEITKANKDAEEIKVNGETVKVSVVK